MFNNILFSALSFVVVVSIIFEGFIVEKIVSNKSLSEHNTKKFPFVEDIEWLRVVPIKSNNLGRKGDE